MGRFTLLLALCSLTAKGEFNLLEEFLVSHLQLKMNRLEKSRAVIERDLFRAGKTWSFAASSRYQNNQLDRSLESPFSNLTAFHYSLGISRDFEWGGRLTFDHILSQLDRSPLPTSLPGGSPLKSNAFQQSLGLSQDLGKNFFGKQFYTSLQGVHENINLSQIVLTQKNQKELDIFYQSYLSARLRKTLLILQKKALQRSLKRLNVARQKVGDGLSEKADLYSAQIDHVKKQEELTTAQFYLKEVLNSLSKSLYRQVEPKEIDQVSLPAEVLTKIRNYKIPENLELKKLTSQLRKLDWELQNLKRDYLPRVVLSGTYRTNDVDEETSQAISKGGLGGSQDEYLITLSLNLPLSFAQERLNEARKKVEIMSLEMRKKQTLEQLKFSQKNLQQEIITLLKNLKFSRRRIELAKKNLKENTRLYHIGKADFDSLIRAEENLIHTERAYVNYWFRYERTIAKKAALYGKLLETIRSNYL